MSDALQALSGGRPEMPARPAPAPEKATIAVPGKGITAATQPGKGADRPEPVKEADTKQSSKEIKEAVDRLNEAMRKEGRDLAFSIDDKLKQTVITVKNAQTGEVVRQIPDKVLLRVAHSIEEMKGLLYDQGI